METEKQKAGEISFVILGTNEIEVTRTEMYLYNSIIYQNKPEELEYIFEPKIEVNDLQLDIFMYLLQEKAAGNSLDGKAAGEFWQRLYEKYYLLEDNEK